MRANFKYIVIAIISSLVIIFFAQLLVLKGLYSSLYKEANQKVYECLEAANINELESRIDSLSKIPITERTSGEISLSKAAGGDTSSSDMYIRSETVSQGKDTTKMISKVKDVSSSLIHTDMMSYQIREGLHQVLDTIIPIQLDRLNTLLSDFFQEKGILSKIYAIEVINLSQDSIMNGMTFLKSKRSPLILDYTYDSQNQLAYRFYIESLINTVLSQMVGILITTFLIILVLVFAFWYLIRTIFQQKTLEELKDDFTKNMTHELKTPIAIAYSATDAMLNFSQGEDKIKRDRYLKVSKDQLEKLSKLVEQILSVSTEQRLKLTINKEPINLCVLLKSICEEYKLSSEKEISFEVNIQPSTCTLLADRIHLTNILTNLIDNAIKYSRQTVLISITVLQEKDIYILKVKDNGLGIASSNLQFLFDKFYRVPQGNRHDVKGSGIGLYYVKTIIEKHDGTIGVASVENEWTEFIIKIPIV